MRLQGEQPVGPPSPWLPVWVPERRLAVSAAELGAGWAGEREDTCLALQRVGGSGKGGFQFAGISLWSSGCSNPDLQALKRPVHSALFLSAGPCSRGFRHHSGPIQLMQADLTGLYALSKLFYPGEPQLHHL